jgi:hypothetical protein
MQGEPLECFEAWRHRKAPSPRLLLVEFELQPYWLDSAPGLPLVALYFQRGDDLLVGVAEPAAVVRQPTVPGFEEWALEKGVQLVSPGRVLPLAPLAVPKPWGQEIWYTGVEERGVCGFGGRRASTPIPWLQAVLPDAAAGVAGEPLVLLKILDPVETEVTGDLYFELHEEKREVYVVTRVDPEAWPDGVGYIRYGFDPQKLAACGSEAEFRRDYLRAVRDYEAVRRALDALPDPDDRPLELVEREADLRHRMDGFTHMRPLAAGDVVVVPLLMPHSLQHGVRTVEFQTPVYERQILSFAQKVLTQDHWDTAAAVEQMRLLPPDPEPFEQLECAAGVLVERVVDFPDFEVRRVSLDAGVLDLEPLADYALVMVVEGELQLEGVAYGPEQACLLPRRWAGRLMPHEGLRRLVFLLALPRC